MVAGFSVASYEFFVLKYDSAGPCNAKDETKLIQNSWHSKADKKSKVSKFQNLNVKNRTPIVIFIDLKSSIDDLFASPFCPFLYSLIPNISWINSFVFWPRKIL